MLIRPVKCDRGSATGTEVCEATSYLLLRYLHSLLLLVYETPLSQLWPTLSLTAALPHDTGAYLNNACVQCMQCFLV